MSEVPSSEAKGLEEHDIEERFELRMTPAFGPRLIGTVLLAIAFVLVLFARPLTATGDLSYLLLLVALAATVPSVLALFGLRRGVRTASIDVLADRVLLPSDGRGRVALPYPALRALFLRKHPLAGFLYVATEDREFIFSTRVFSAGDAQRLHEMLLTRVRSTSDRVFERIERTSRRAHQAYRRTPVVTWGLVLIMTGLHVLFISSGKLWNGLDVASLGAVSPELVEVSGPYRAFTAHWVHGFRFQPLLVLPALFVSGSLVERLLGHGSLAAVVLGASAVGGLATAFFPGSPMHSGGLLMVAGLVGALFYIAYRFQNRLPVGFSLNGQWWSWVVTVGVVAALVHGLSVPGVLVAMVWGGAISVLVLEAVYELPVIFSPRWTAYLAVVLLAVHLGCAALAVEKDRGRGLEFEKIAVEASQDIRILREYAFQVANRGSLERMELALVAIDRALGMADSELPWAAVQDTKARVLVAMGRIAEAREAVLELVLRFPDSKAFVRRLAELLLEPHADATSVRVVKLGEEDSLVFARSAFDGVPRPVGWAAVADDEGEPAALLRLPLATETATLADSARLLRLKPGDVVPIGVVRPGRATARLWDVSD